MILPQTISEAVARSALQALVRRHAVLRTYYALSNAAEHAATPTLCQVIQPEDGFVVPLSVCPDASRWREFVDSELYTPFEPFQRPPIRALLLVSMPSVLVVNVHHAAADAVAFEIMRSELAGHCAALLRHLPPPSLPFVAMEYADFARSEVASGQDEEALA